jgi:hypothetical protein
LAIFFRKGNARQKSHDKRGFDKPVLVSMPRCIVAPMPL